MRDLQSQLLYTPVFFEPPLSAEELAELETTSDPWGVLALLVHRASRGDFTGIGRVEALMRSFDSYFFWSAATTFVGLAGPRRTVEAIDESFRGERHRRGVRCFMSSMLRYACSLEYAERILECYEAAVDDEDRDEILWALASLFGPDHADVESGAPVSDKYPILDDDDDVVVDYAGLGYSELFAKVSDHEAHRRTVVDARAAIYASGVPQGSAVFWGAVLDARRLVRGLADPASSSEGARLLSAMTGKGGFSADAHAIRALLDDPAIAAMVPGRRYFFGHLIPD